MALSKKGSRIITVDGVKYRWLIRRKATYTQSCYLDGCLHVAIELAQSPGMMLLLWTDRPHPEGYAILPMDVIPITPADIANWIRQSLELGWKPELKDGTLTFNVSENQVLEIAS
jgi:hypothetical protein